ncbi:DUF6162 family protein [Pseudomonas monteilii]|uniref:DUF6162 family protein n=1 Tax=Pseudomonas alabamensis TaxID=3064349 RepID=UPI000745E3ED|nr:DUF6162 family protein [Pseudomonas entomophila]AMA46345.1 hypothetical protein APT63_12335 [Pseudomonas monteilii]
MSRTQVVRPAGAGHESLYVLLVALLIVIVAGTVVTLRGEREDEVRFAAHQIDARRDLSAAEQGLFTDLHVAFDEIRLLQEERGELPDVAQLADEGLPPFVTDASSVSRGGHRWTLLDSGAYLGRSQDRQVAGDLLMLPPGAPEASADVWLLRASGGPLPDALTSEALAAQGWRQVTTHYDAGVTRQHRH